MTPEHLVAARQVKKHFTGDLNAEMNTYPVFPGKERHYLRAQIARIASGTLLVPRGLYRVCEEDVSSIELEEEPTMLGLEEATSEESWVHLRPHILNSGRATHEVLEEEEVDVEELQNKMAEEDPAVERLRGINEDENWAEEERPWTFSLIGDTQIYGLKTGEGNNCYGVTVIKNKRWNGAVTLYKGGKFTALYLGYGLKSTDRALRPQGPPDVTEDPEDPTEQPEPTPLEAPEELESDSEEENKDEEDEY